MMRLRGKGGFTLVEIMIVVAIIALLAAIAIPNFGRMRINANETAAIATLKTISTAEEAYRAAQTTPTYGTFAQLTAGTTPYLDSTFAAATVTRSGYTFTFTVAPAANVYEAQAAPTTAGTTGVRTFRVDQQGIIRDVTSGAPGTPIQ